MSWVDGFTLLHLRAGTRVQSRPSGRWACSELIRRLYTLGLLSYARGTDGTSFALCELLAAAVGLEWFPPNPLLICCESAILKSSYYFLLIKRVILPEKERIPVNFAGGVVVSGARPGSVYLSVVSWGQVNFVCDLT